MRLNTTPNWQFLAILLLFLAPSFASGGNAGDSTKQQAAESAATTSHASTNAVQLQTPSDRESAGLRGAVADCIDETKDAQVNWTMVYETKYDADGRALERGYTNNDGSKGLETFTYDAEGHLLRTAWSGNAQGGTIYNYDSQGRLTGITGQGDWTTTVEYDDQGRESRTVKSTLTGDGASSQARLGASVERENVDLFAAPPPGGWVTTAFNERNQAVESRVYGSDGQLISRLTRSYDEKGRVAESAYAIASFESLLSPATRERLASDPQAFEQVQSQLAKFLGPQQILFRISYTYDGQGRVSQRDDNLGSSDDNTTKTSYNDHGDESQEIQITSHGTQPPVRNIVNVTYQYDSVGNWTEKTTSSAPTAKEPSRILSVERRTITYY
jgi:YD repeat-containing protein